MNSGQRVIVWVGIGLILLAGIYPPWIHARRSYDWLFAKEYAAAKGGFYETSRFAES